MRINLIVLMCESEFARIKYLKGDIDEEKGELLSAVPI